MTETNQIIAALHSLLQADKAVTHRAARHRDKPLAKAVGWAAELADEPQLLTLSVVTAAVGLATGRRDVARAGARMLAAHLVAIGAKSVLKHTIDRSRPKHALETGEERFEPGTSDDHQQQSFASGHTAGMMAVTRAAAHEIDGMALPGMVATAAVAAAQPFAGNHYVTDVVAGAVIGLVAEALVGVAFDRWTWGEDANPLSNSSIENDLGRGNHVE